MLRFTKRADYGLMAMHYIACQTDEGAVSAKRIAEEFRIPPELLAKILQRLAKRKLIVSHNGPNVGRVPAVRPGYNPDVPVPFQVIQVTMEGGGVREFAAEFAGHHRLNDDAVLLSPADELVPPQDIYTRYRDTFVPHLRTLLHASPEFVWLAGKWFPRSLLVQINEGQLNIAEAITGYEQRRPAADRSVAARIGFAGRSHPRAANLLA